MTSLHVEKVYSNLMSNNWITAIEQLLVKWAPKGYHDDYKVNPHSLPRRVWVQYSMVDPYKIYLSG